MRSGWLSAISAVAAAVGVSVVLGLVAGAPRTAAAQAAGSIRLVPVVQRGLEAPVFATHAGDGSGRLFVVEQPGRVRVVANGRLLPRPFLNLGGRVRLGGERGLLGLAFHPRYRSNGRFFVSYTRRPDGASVVSEFRVSGNPGVAGSTERVLLAVPQPAVDTHKGGMIAFGRSGNLFWALGDGGSSGDPGNRAQNRNLLLGKILRIGVDGARPYTIPADNPFARGGGRREIYALGFRNPWRFSFDRGTGWLWAGDVGQNRFEEINIVRPGGNYGWRLREGEACFNPVFRCRDTGLAPPVDLYTHVGGRCAITGGYVYRGRNIPALIGAYVYADFCTGEIFGRRGDRTTRLLDTALPIVSFGEDQAGELLVVGIGGTLHRVARRAP